MRLAVVSVACEDGGRVDGLGIKLLMGTVRWRELAKRGLMRAITDSRNIYDRMIEVRRDNSSE